LAYSSSAFAAFKRDLLFFPYTHSFIFVLHSDKKGCIIIIVIITITLQLHTTGASHDCTAHLTLGCEMLAMEHPEADIKVANLYIPGIDNA
jgi:hypothetical protein